MTPKSLRGQLTRAAMLTTFLAMLLSAGALLAYELLTYRNIWRNDLRTQADLIATSTATALVFDDPRTARETLASLKARPGIRAAAIYGKNGDLIATYSAAEDGQTATKAAALPPIGFHFNGSTIETVSPIQHDGERVGTLYLRALHNIWPRLVGYAVILGAISLGSLAFAFYVFGSLQGRLTLPLARMTEVAREVVSTRNWALRAPETEYRDIKVLVEAFNSMLTECGTRTRELELQDRRKDEFLATLAHELRNPLAPMTTAVALLEMPAVPSQAKANAVAMLARQLRHMVRLIDDLLDASRIATGKLSLEMKAVDLSQTLRAAVELTETEAARRGLSLSLELPVESLYVAGDTVRLSQVFSNLLNNACKYTKAGGRIDVSASHEAGTVEVNVRDTGIGIDPAMQNRIFELFEQVDKSMERGSAGLGIGLTLTRQLIEMHGGSVSVLSEGLGHGACFRVRLPTVSGEDERRAQGPSPARPDRLQILIADDNVDLAESLAQVLGTAGHAVDVVHDGSAAVASATARVPDVALIDIGMPYNGHLVARDLRANPATQTMRLVAITGWGDSSEQTKAQQAGFDRRLVKPVEPERLLALLAELFPPRAEGARFSEPSKSELP